MAGAVTVDRISSLNISLTRGTRFDGPINAAGEGGAVNVTIDESSVWSLTGDTWVTKLTEPDGLDPRERAQTARRRQDSPLTDCRKAGRARDTAGCRAVSRAAARRPGPSGFADRRTCAISGFDRRADPGLPASR
jgi:hypothetical protein